MPLTNRRLVLVPVLIAKLISQVTDLKIDSVVALQHFRFIYR